MQYLKNRVTFLTLWLYAMISLAAGPTGMIKGRVLNAETKEPLVGANVMVLYSQWGSSSNEDGNFRLPELPAGSYNVAVEYIGFERYIESDVIVRPGRITFLEIELEESFVQGKQVVVTAGYFQKRSADPTSIISFNNEEIRRSPGSGGDVTRILMALPSTAQVHDHANDLVVRGGSPMENGFYIDNVQIQNINHFSVHGTTGGGIGLINVDFIKEVEFYTGGFSAKYGDRLSSVTVIKLREGNTEEYDAQIDMNLAGLGGSMEGPLPNGKGSWLFSARRGFMDLLVEAVGSGVAPRYGDTHTKITYHLNPRNQLTLIDILGTSRIEYNLQQARDYEFMFYGGLETRQNTVGINWRHLWKKQGYSNTTISHSFISNDIIWNDVAVEKPNYGNMSTESTFRLRNVNYCILSKGQKLEFGVEIENIRNGYDYFAAQDTNRMGIQIPALDVKERIVTYKSGAFVSYISHPIKPLTLTAGLRGDFFAYNQRFHVAPRLSISYRLSNRLTFKFATGVFYQNLPLIILTQDEENKNLRDLVTTHYVFGVDYLLTADTKLTVEVYDKEYRDSPLSSDDPYNYVIDEGQSMQFFITSHLRSVGRAYSRGIELLLQKKLAEDFYGLVSATYFRSRYRDYLNKWRDRTFDNRYIFSVIGGYKPNKKWEFSTRWVFAGGIPYTPFDLEKSQVAHTGIIDQSKINAKRYPNYHSLNLRFDRRFYFQRANLIMYLSIWNAYNRKNVSRYYWDPGKNRQTTFYQFSLIPILGLEFEF